MTWEIQYIDKALKDLEKLDNSQRLLVLKAVQKVQINPLPDYEGGYGKPLGNHSQSKLAGLLKIKLKKMGLRVIYQVKKENGIMKIIVISIRDDEMVYKLAEKRLRDVGE